MKALLLSIFLMMTVYYCWAQNPWNQVYVPTTHKLNAIDFVNSSVGYIVGDSNTILKTTDGGVNWTILNHTGINPSPFSHSIVDVHFVSENVGFVAVLNDTPGIYKTTDGGLNWSSATNSISNMCYMGAVHANSENDYFVGGAGCFQSAKIDRFVDPNWLGSTVNYESFDPNQYVTDFAFEGSVGLATMNNPYLLRSTDNGLTWDTISVGVNSTARLTEVIFQSPSVAYVGYNDNGSGFALKISVDGGHTWNDDMTTATFYYPAFLCLGKSNTNVVYTGGKSDSSMGGIIFNSTAPQALWDYWAVDEPINGIDSYGTDTTFGVGDNGYVVVNKQWPTSSLSEFAVDPISIYPNPTNDVFTVGNSSHQSMKFELIDALENKISVHSIEATEQTLIDISNLPNGIYYLQSSNGATSTTTTKIVKI